jgi:hypothetical protein
VNTQAQSFQANLRSCEAPAGEHILVRDTLTLTAGEHILVRDTPTLTAGEHILVRDTLTLTAGEHILVRTLLPPLPLPLSLPLTRTNPPHPFLRAFLQPVPTHTNRSPRRRCTWNPFWRGTREGRGSSRR